MYRMHCSKLHIVQVNIHCILHRGVSDVRACARVYVCSFVSIIIVIIAIDTLLNLYQHCDV